MSKVTSKYQVTLPKAIATRYRIRPGDDILWQEAGDAIRVITQVKSAPIEDPESRLRLFDRATERLRRRAAGRKVKQTANRGWTRQDLYTRGRSR